MSKKYKTRKETCPFCSKDFNARVYESGAWDAICSKCKRGK